jgi:hypothetical protein
MSETDETTAVEPEATADEAPVVEAEPEDAPVAEAEPESDVQAEDGAEPEPEAAPEPEAESEPEALAAEPVAIPMPARVAKVFLCERGHRTTVLWSDPTTCQARPFRHGPPCGRQLYPIGELPEQVRKALNPLKASKKSSKK